MIARLVKTALILPVIGLAAALNALIVRDTLLTREFFSFSFLTDLIIIGGITYLVVPLIVYTLRLWRK